MGSALAPSSASAAPGPTSVDDPATVAAPSPVVGRIIGGDEAATCQFAATVALRSADGQGASWCSGSLIHPSIVIYAAHCGDRIDTIFFGEQVARVDASDVATVTHPARQINMLPGSCRLYPGHDPANGSDFAYCRLPSPITDVPIVPVLMGCETQVLGARQPVIVAGYGRDGNQQLGTKHVLATDARPLAGNKVGVGAAGFSTCHGDSGGPAFIQLPEASPILPGGDGTWRLFGITSYGSDGCSEGSYFSLAHLAVPWIEADSGIDVTPCSSATGEWRPTPGCGDFALNLFSVAGSWASGCKLTSLRAGPSQTCGAAYDASAGTALVLQAGGAGSAASGDEEGGGPPASACRGGGSGAMMALFVAVALLPAVRRRGLRRVVLGLVLVLGLGGCGIGLGTGAPAGSAAAGGSGPAAGSAVPLAGAVAGDSVVAAQPLPAASHRISGQVLGHPVPAEAVIFAYGFYGGRLMLFVYAADEAATCQRQQALRSLRADGVELRLQINGSGGEQEQPDDGTYPIVADVPAPGPGPWAMANLLVSDGNCKNQLGDPAYATEGSVSVQTHLSAAGAYLTGTLNDVRFGGQGVLSGPFTALPCNLDLADNNLGSCR